MYIIQRLIVIVACLLAFLPSLQATPPPVVGFSVTPSVVSNTYNGYVTLLITGLTNTETVVVQKYLDANGNGVLDPGEPLWQQFALTDGTNTQIGGVTNINVPGDTDTVPGQITARINFQAAAAQRITGNYLYQLSSPFGHFLPITISFTVTNFPYSQKFTGTVLGTSGALTNAGVILFQVSTNNGLNAVGGAVSSAAGVYTIPAPPGLYALAAFQSNYVGNIVAAAFLELAPGRTINTNLSLLPATRSIFGKIQVAGNPGLGLPGMLVPVQTKNGFLAVGVSDTNGNFKVPVTPNAWQVSVDSAAMAAAGCVGLQNNPTVDTTTNSVSGVPINLCPATALFYGTVKDSFGNPLPGVVDVEASDTDQDIYQADGFTDDSGNFIVAALGGLGPDDPWWVQVDNASSFPNYLFSQPAFDNFGGTNLAPGQTVSASMIAIIATNQISGHVQTSAGQAIVGVGVSANATLNGYDFNAYVDTDANGNYAFNVGNGSWNVSLNSQYGSDSLNTILGQGTFQFPPNQTIGLTNQDGLANFTVEPCDGVQILTTNLPSAQTGIYYSFFLNGSTCTGQQTWSLSDPQDFPQTLDLTPDGQIQGNPAQSGTYHFTVQLSDNNGGFTTRNLSLVVTAAGGPLQITTTFLANATQNAFYSTQLAATGGAPPYAWSLYPGSANPPFGLTLNTNGFITGTPIGSGVSSFIPMVTDSLGASTHQTLSFTIAASGLPQIIKLAVIAPPALGAFQFTFAAASGIYYTVQSSPDLKNWADYQTVYFNNSNPTSGKIWTVTIPNPPVASQIFYRVKVGP